MQNAISLFTVFNRLSFEIGYDYINYTYVAAWLKESALNNVIKTILF